MKNFAGAFWAETLKTRRSKVPWISAIGFSIAPLVGGLFMIILKDPEAARQAGLISAKAQIMAGEASWPAFLGLLSHATAVGGLVVFSLVLSWIFGREFSDRTAKDLLAVVTPRSTIVAAKFAVFGTWSALLTAFIYILGLAVGAAVGLPGYTSGIVARGAWELGLVALMTVAVLAPIALAASAGRGYLPALGTALFLLAAAQILAYLGWGEYFPWSVPALYAGIGGTGSNDLGPVSFVILGLTGIGGAVATFLWWERADHTK